MANQPAPEAVAAPAALPKSEGFDVSEAGTVVWPAIKPRWSFAFIEATQGATLQNSSFAAGWHGSAGAGVVRGAYHFFYAKSSTPAAQAYNFTNWVQQHGGFQPGDLPPILDVEESSVQGLPAQTVSANFKAFLADVTARVAASTGNARFAPMIYTDHNTWAGTLGDPDFSHCPLWIANYTSAAQPAVPTSWGDGNWLFWQYGNTVKGVVPGASADLDRFNVLGNGARGNEVRRVQQWLRETATKRHDAALDPGSVDGGYGPHTASAVQRLQALDLTTATASSPAMAPLPQTGAVDVVTWAKLLWA